MNDYQTRQFFDLLNRIIEELHAIRECVEFEKKYSSKLNKAIEQSDTKTIHESLSHL